MGILAIWLIYSKYNKGKFGLPFVSINGLNTYTLHEPGGWQVKMGFEGPYKKDTSINWRTVTLDFNTEKLEIPIPDNWTVKKIDNDKNFISTENKSCRLFTATAYLIQDPNNIIELTYNPICGVLSDELGMEQDETIVTINFEDAYTDGKNALATRFYDTDHDVYRYGPSGGVTSSKKPYSTLAFMGKDNSALTHLLITLKYKGSENKRWQYLRIVDWIDAHPGFQ